MINRLAIVRSSPSPIDPNRYNVQEGGLARALVARGVEIDIYSAVRNLSGWTELAHDSGATLINVPWHPIGPGHGYHPSLAKRLKKGGYDAIQYHEESQPTSVAVARQFKKIPGTKTILYQGMYRRYGGLSGLAQTAYNSVCLSGLIRHTDIPLAKTARARQYLEDLGFRDVTVVPPGLDIGSFAESIPLPVDVERFVSSSRPLFLYVGALDHRRHPEFLLNVFDQLRGTHPDAGLLVIGQGPKEEIVTRRADGRTIFFYPSVPQQALPALYRRADCFLLPSTYEIFGMVVAECIWFGLPIVTTHEAGPEELSRLTRWPGLSLCELNIDDWSDGVRRILEKNREELERGSLECRDLLSWDRAAEQYCRAVGCEDSR